MTLDIFLEHIEAHKPLDTTEIYRFMDEMSDEARRITFELNGSYLPQDQLRELFARLFGKRD